mmetsp:Transcript_15843/g.23545  ORF Transcript_15843/g.23545 Transcript_15843/m.23545 type:complete len:94 (+) Transcript_15843:86-367(+)
MDYKGQQLAENIYYILILLFGAVSWIIGYVMENFMYPVYGVGAATAISILICVPDWPIFNRNPVKWLDELPEREGVERVGAAAEKVKRAKKNT